MPCCHAASLRCSTRGYAFRGDHGINGTSEWIAVILGWKAHVDIRSGIGSCSTAFIMSFSLSSCRLISSLVHTCAQPQLSAATSIPSRPECLNTVCLSSQGPRFQALTRHFIMSHYIHRHPQGETRIPALSRRHFIISYHTSHHPAAPRSVRPSRHITAVLSQHSRPSERQAATTRHEPRAV